MQPPETARASVSRLLTVQQLADLLQVPHKTIYTWRYKGVGPPAVRVGKYLRFRVEGVAAWLDSRSDPGQSDARRGPLRPRLGGNRGEGRR
jgi:excisionase family DNA binding protein